jgi:hypothetical protein
LLDDRNTVIGVAGLWKLSAIEDDLYKNSWTEDCKEDYSNSGETWEWACEATKTLLGLAHDTEQSRTPAWPSLRSLSLTQVLMKKDDLLAIIRDHAATLRQLTLGEYDLDRSFFKNLAKLASSDNLKLSSIQVFQDRVKPQCTDKFLLRYLQGEFGSDQMSKYSGCITTHQRLLADGDRELSQDDARSEHTMEYLPGDERREIRWSLGDSTGEMMPVSYLIKHEDNHASDADAGDADASNDDASEADSIDGQDKRVAVAPRWKSGRFFSSPLDKYGAIWCWPVQTRDGHRTCIWEFRHHSGEWAYGTEPLSFFEDWDCAVDSAIPTPGPPETV